MYERDCWQNHWKYIHLAIWHGIHFNIQFGRNRIDSVNAGRIEMQTQQHNIAVWEFIRLLFSLTKIYRLFLLKLNIILFWFNEYFHPPNVTRSEVASLLSQNPTQDRTTIRAQGRYTWDSQLWFPIASCNIMQQMHVWCLCLLMEDYISYFAQTWIRKYPVCRWSRNTTCRTEKDPT